MSYEPARENSSNGRSPALPQTTLDVDLVMTRRLHQSSRPAPTPPALQRLYSPNPLCTDYLYWTYYTFLVDHGTRYTDGLSRTPLRPRISTWLRLETPEDHGGDPGSEG